MITMNEVDKQTTRNVRMKKSSWAQIEFIYLKKGYNTFGDFIESLLEEGKL